MRLLLDECLPRRLKASLSPHACSTAREVGLSGVLNGRLLSQAEALGFEVLITADKGFEHQQNVSGRKLAVLLLRAQTNRIRDLLPLVPQCLAALQHIRPGDLKTVS